jgi:hypothetical protein
MNAICERLVVTITHGPAGSAQSPYARSPAGAREQGQDAADGGFLAGGFRQRKVRLDLVAVAAAFFLLRHAAGSVRSVTMPQALRPVLPGPAAMSRSRPVAGDAQQQPGVAGQDTPARQPEERSQFLEIYC